MRPGRVEHDVSANLRGALGCLGTDAGPVQALRWVDSLFVLAVLRRSTARSPRRCAPGSHRPMPSRFALQASPSKGVARSLASGNHGIIHAPVQRITIAWTNG